MLAVTGITGHSGRHFINVLEKNNYTGKLRCFIHKKHKASCITDSDLDYEIFEGSLDSESDIRTFLTGVDTVLHIANIHFSPEIIRIGQQCGVNRYILVHTTGIFSKYKSASSEYIEIENQILSFMKELNITILRPTMIFGDICDYNISKFIKMIDLFPIVPVITRGKSLIQPVNARDLAQAYFKALMTEKSIGNAYNLSGETPISIYELYRLIAECLGKKRMIISFPIKACVAVARFIKKISVEKIDFVEKVERMGENRHFSHEEARNDFGYEPEPFAIGLLREVEEYLRTKSR